jgi:hypothetical protein
MDGSDAASPAAEPDNPPESAEPRHPGFEPEPGSGAGAAPPVSFWLRELPYVVVLILTLFGVAYMGFSKQSIVGYWEFLTPVIGLLCIGDGWRHANDKDARVRLVWAQVLHWLAFLVAMNLILLSGVQATFSSNATGLMILILLALGTFTAGVHILSWQICVLGVIMALGVPALAWIERSALFILLIVVAVAAIAMALWWGGRRSSAASGSSAAKG